MARKSIAEKIRVWKNIYRRIRFFKRMYPLSVMAKDALLFPLDYMSDGKKIGTVRNITFVITHRCNIRCEMCYFHEELNNSHVLPLDVFTKVVDETAHCRPCIQLTGGEPFTHPQLLEMVEYAKSKGLPVQIFSNGTLAAPHIADRLVALGLDYMNFTLLGNETSHSEVARVPGSYEKLAANLAYFAANRGRTLVILNYTITPRALGDIDHAFELVRRHKLDGLRIQHYMYLLPREFEAQDKVMQRLFGMQSVTHEAECVQDVSFMAERLLELKARIGREYPEMQVQWAPTLTDEEIRHWYSMQPFRTERKCLFPWRGLQVDADGRIYPCSKIYLDLGDARETPVFEAWNADSMAAFRRFLKKGLYPACSRCCRL